MQISRLFREGFPRPCHEYLDPAGRPEPSLGGSLERQAQSEYQMSTAESIQFCIPRKTRAVSVTGGGCALGCAHCGGRWLKGMAPLESILLEEPRRSSSLLVSGGCTPSGEVPLSAHAPALQALKDRGYRLNVHVGPGAVSLPAEVAAFADVVSVDCVTDGKTIREVFGLDGGRPAGLDLLRALKGVVPTVPHVTLGLLGGEMRGEAETLHALRELGTEALVFLILVPTRGTRYEAVSPPAAEEVERIFALARELMPSARLSLGCMRPPGAYRELVDALAYDYRFARVVMPSRALRRRAARDGRAVDESWECCAL